MKLDNLQVLRGISALLVCCFHFRADLNFDDYRWGDLLFSKGSVGVQIFFVISGFIMVYSTKRVPTGDRLHHMLSFIKKRLIRIVPLYYILTFLWIILGGSVYYYFQPENMNRLISSLLFLPPKNQFPVLFLGWSLNYEMFFYLLFAIAFFFGRYRYYFVIAIITLLYFASRIFTAESGFLHLATHFMNFYFVAGILIALYIGRWKLHTQWWKILCLPAVLPFCLYFFGNLSVINKWALLLAVSLLVIVFLSFDLFLKVKASSILRKLGDISYSVYLSHPFVEIYFRRFQSQSPVVNVSLFILKMFIVVVVSKILYELLEKRLTNYLKGTVKPAPQTTEKIQ